MRFRDPDLGRDRTTLALGRRDWGFFSETEGLAPVERRAATAPWGDGRPVTTHDRFDRTLGIPDRATPMWPATGLSFHEPGVSATARAEAICDVLCVRPLPTWRWPRLPTATALLREAAPDLYRRPPTVQAAVVAAAARHHGVEPTTAWDLAVGVGALVAQTTHRQSSPAPGAPSLNALAGADLDAATELFLARDRLRLAQQLSDPDLPRLWILANGLAHGVPPEIIWRVPARSVGAIAQVVPTHDDLVGWAGVRPAVEHLRDVVRAAVEGRRWLEAGHRGDLDERVLALGVVGLTRPATAMQLALCGLRRLGFDQLREVAGPAPGGVLDLSDAALKAVCDRNGWLTGVASERTQRELVERVGPAVEPEVLRASLADGDPGALEAFSASAPSDHLLDVGAFRKNPSSAEADAAHRLLTEGGREALRRFAGVEPPHRASLAEALAHRFPERCGRDVLCERHVDRLLASEAPAPRPSPAVPLSLDLGL
ncbi:MAG: hypothetical protein CYG61_06115 [Actinobacteria bacterium]|nr:MAG: hypothetical protein CYG61_06115 [Actinomycetota bacterium]